jgi:hypothetical protein
MISGQIVGMGNFSLGRIFYSQARETSRFALIILSEYHDPNLARRCLYSGIPHAAAEQPQDLAGGVNLAAKPKIP